MKIIFILLSLIFSLPTFAKKEAELKDIKTMRGANGYRVDLIFDQAIGKDEYTVDFINETVQVNIPGATIPDKKEFTKVNDEEVKHLYTYQTKEGLRHRIILQPGTAAVKYEGNVKLAANGSTLSVELIKEVVAQEEDGLNSILRALPAKTEVKTEIKTVSVKTDKTGSALSAEEQALFKAVTEIESQPVVAKVEEKKKNLNEAEIPIFKEKPKKAESSQSTYWRFLISLVVVFAMGGGIYLVAKKYSHKQLSKNKHNSIRVMTQHYLGPKKSLAIVTVAGESILIGITDHNITPIKTLSLLEEEIPEVASGSFSDSMKTADSKAFAETKESAADDEFSIQGIKDIVRERLNGMRNI